MKMKARINATVEPIAREKVEEYQEDYGFSSFSGALEHLIMQFETNAQPSKNKASKPTKKANKATNNIMNNYK